MSHICSQVPTYIILYCIVAVVVLQVQPDVATSHVQLPEPRKNPYRWRRNLSVYPLKFSG